METVTWGKGNSDSGSESWPRNAAGPTQEKTSLQKPQILRPLTKAANWSECQSVTKHKLSPSPPGWPT